MVVEVSQRSELAMELEDIDGASKGRWSKVKPLKQHIFTLLALLASLGI